MSITIQKSKQTLRQFPRAEKKSTSTSPTGKLVSLLGPSGCGKTTLLRIIAGLENADGGQILFDGQDVTAKHVRAQSRLRFNLRPLPPLNVFDNVAFGLTVLPKSERPSKNKSAPKSKNCSNSCSSPHLAKSYPHQLSGGQRQRIALAAPRCRTQTPAFG